MVSMTSRRLQRSGWKKAEDNECLFTAEDRSPTCTSTVQKNSCRKVGLLDPHYNLQYVSYGMNVPGYTFSKVRRVPLHRLDRGGTFWAYTPFVLDTSVDLLHTFNMIPMNARRFVMSCEMELPRYLGTAHSWQNRIGYRLLRSNACRAILGLSEIACRQGREKFVGLGLPDIADKIQLFRGTIGQTTTVPFRDRNLGGPLKLLFVGRNALRKGLIPTLSAIEDLRSGGVDVRLTVVSSLDSSDDYLYENAKDVCIDVRQQIEKWPWIAHCESASNDVVRRMMREHDLLILPTFDESLGWVLVEAGMERCPSIATNVFAIPELIDDRETGRLLSLPLSESSRWFGLGLASDAKQEAIWASHAMLRGQIIDAIDAIASNRDCLNRWGAAALEKMDNMFNRDRSTEQLRAIYDNAFA